jgi:leucyl aminopeptidase (aminopeptidase T)
LDPRIIDIVKYMAPIFELNQEEKDTNSLVIADTATDPVVWQGIAAASSARGLTPTIAIMTPRAHHQDEPTPAVAKAMTESDIFFEVPTKAMAHSLADKSAQDLKRKAIRMEETTYEMLTTGGVTADHKEMEKLGIRVENAMNAGKNIHITSEFGTDLTAKLSSVPCVASTGRCRTEKGHYHTSFPAGECAHGTEQPTANGIIVWDTSAHQVGILKEPIKLTIKNNRVVKMEGGAQATQLREYIETYGDENRWNCPAEISPGLNPNARVRGIMREDKKLLGACHIATGNGSGLRSNIHIDGIIRRPTITVDDKTVIENGKFMV